MILLILIAWLLFGGILAWIAGIWSKLWPRIISLVFLGVSQGVFVNFWAHDPARIGLSTEGPWMLEYNVPWIPQLNIHFNLALDGLSLLLILLVQFLGIMAVLASWKGIQYKVGFFHFNLLWILAALTGVFLAIDMFLFYFFWEFMLVPLYLLIGIWGHENRVYATLKFFIFTQASGLLMLLSILGIYYVHGHNTGIYTFDYNQLINAVINPTVSFWLMMGFFVAFAVKLPAFPLHTWLPDAHAEAPTAGSVDLAGLVLKVGAYGFLRFLIPLFPAEAFKIAPYAMILGIIGILYGAMIAYAQTDFKRLVAYTSVSGMGFVLVGTFAWNQLALQGAMIVMLTHGISTGALFILVGMIQDRTHTRDMNRLGGLWHIMPQMGKATMFFAMAALGLPGIGNFIGEFLVLLGTYQYSIPIAVFATLGFIVSTIYSLAIMQRVFFGENKENWKLPDLDFREYITMAAMILVLIWFGIYPRQILDTSNQAFQTLRSYTEGVPRQESVVNSTAFLFDDGTIPPMKIDSLEGGNR